jgi:hypothetical protein
MEFYLEWGHNQMTTKLTKITINGNALSDCLKCKGEDSMYAIAHMKWNTTRKWHHLIACTLCGYEKEA